MFARRSTVFVLPALAAALWATSMTPAVAQTTPVHFQISWLPTGDYAAYTAGIEKGFYRDAGIDLTMSTGRGSGDAVKKVASGASPFGDSDISAVMAARMKEQAPVKCIMSQYVTSAHALFVLEGSGIESLKDIQNKTLATTVGNSHFLYFPLLARMNGIDPKTVTWVNVEAGAMAPMLIGGKVDGATFAASHEYYQNKEAQKYGKKIKVIPYSDYGFKIYAHCLIARDEVIASNPDLTRRFIQASQRSFLWAKDNIQETATLHNKRYPDVAIDDAMGNMRALFKVMFNANTEQDGFGFFNAERLAETYKVVAESQELDPKQNPQQFVDTSLVPPKGK